MDDFIKIVYDSIPSDLCRDIIEKFNTDPELHQGKLGPGLLNTNMKDTTDLHIMHRDDWKDITNLLVKHLADSLQEYFKYIEKNVFGDKNLKILSKIFGDNISYTGFQVQRYKSGGAFNWHTDDAYNSKRLLAFIWYLNTVDVESGGSTDFLNGKSVQPKEGSILFFPATWSYIHRGNVVTKGEKYIITGFITQSNLKICNEQ